MANKGAGRPCIRCGGEIGKGSNIQQKGLSGKSHLFSFKKILTTICVSRNIDFQYCLYVLYRPYEIKFKN